MLYYATKILVLTSLEKNIMRTISGIKQLLVLILFTIMGCEKVSTSQVFTLGVESTFRINQLYISSDGQYTLLIKEISDSRCPEGLVCVWSGEVCLKGEWTGGGTKTPVELHTFMNDQEKEPDGFTIHIVDVKPYPKYGTESKPEDLVITLLIQKK